MSIPIVSLKNGKIEVTFVRGVRPEVFELNEDDDVRLGRRFIEHASSTDWSPKGDGLLFSSSVHHPDEEGFKAADTERISDFIKGALGRALRSENLAPLKTYLLSWDGTPEAVILAKDDDQAESAVYKHHKALHHAALMADREPRGTVRHWSWRELPVIRAD